MLNRIKEFYKLFTIGHEVVNPAFWKKGQAVVQPIVASFIMLVVTILKGFGYDLPVSDDVAFMIAGGLFFVVNAALTVISSKTIGLAPTATTAKQIEKAPETPIEKPVVEASNARIDDDTRSRAEQWVKQQTSNGLQNDA